MAEKPVVENDTLSRAAFLGGLLALVSLVALSVVGLGHARAIRGAANAQYWIVTLLVAAALAGVAIALARTPARTSGGETARRIGVAAAALWLCVFLWEAVAIGTGALPGPFELAWGVYSAPTLPSSSN